METNLLSARDAMEAAVSAGLLESEAQQRWILAVARAVTLFRKRYDIPQVLIGKALRMSQPQISSYERPTGDRNMKTFTWLEIHRIENIVVQSGVDPSMAFGEIFRLAALDMEGHQVPIRSRVDGEIVSWRPDHIVAQGSTVEDAIAADTSLIPEVREAFLAMIKIYRRTGENRDSDLRLDRIEEVNGELRIGQPRARRQPGHIEGVRFGPRFEESANERESAQ